MDRNNMNGDAIRQETETTVIVKPTIKSRIMGFVATHPVVTKVIIGGLVAGAAGIGYAMVRAITGTSTEEISVTEQISIEGEFEPEEDAVSEND